jgi:hypothetical protein
MHESKNAVDAVAFLARGINYGLNCFVKLAN